MLQRYSYKKLTWIDLENPTEEDVRVVVDEYGIDPVVAKELMLSSVRPKVDLHKNFIFLTLRFPEMQKSDWSGKSQCLSQEIDFVIGKNFIITTHYSVIDPLHRFSRIFDANSMINKSDMGEHAGSVFYYMMRTLYHSVEEDLDYINNALEGAEESIFTGREREMVRYISEISRSLMIMTQTLNQHKEVLESLKRASISFFGEEIERYMEEIIGEHAKVQRTIENNKGFLVELRRTNDSLLETKQNDIIKTLTVLSFFMLPLTLITGLFGINTQFTPIVGSSNDFWIIISIMGITSLFLYVIFKQKEWL